MITIGRMDYVKKILSFSKMPLIKILFGVRRCGKSTILLMLVDEFKRRGISEKNIIYYNFDTMKNDHIRKAKALYKDISKKIKNKKRYYLFLDEIQEIEGWERTVNSLMVDFDVDIYVTGSNSKMLSQEISTYLTGRYVSINVYPLSFEEYLQFKKSYTKKLDNTKNEFLQYLKRGGFPGVNLWDSSLDEAYTIVRDIYGSAVLKDVVERGKVRNFELFERVVKFTFENVGKTFSAKSLSDYLKSQKRKLDIETVYNYLSLLEKAFILYRCSRFDLQGKEILKTQEKFYLSDPAFKYAAFGFDSKSIAAMLENIIYLELRRRGYDVYIGKNYTKEIDFVAIRRNEKIYVQVCRRIDEEDTEKREYENLLSIRDAFPKYVVHMDDTLSSDIYEGIKIMHISDFLRSREF